MSIENCPICGRRLEFRHKCDPKVLRAIDAAMKREPPEERRKSEGQRLYEGLSRMYGDG